MRLHRPAVDLTYCTNIHPGQTWAETAQAVQTYVPQVRDLLGTRPFGVGLRLSGQAAEELATGGHLQEFHRWLQTEGLYVVTLNGFPYGPFHGTAVKDNVYRPDWSESQRLHYTTILADVLEALIPADAGYGSISTVPVCFASRATDERLERATAHLIDAAVELWQRTQRGGPTIVLALEPEPACHLETLDDTITWFEERLWRTQSIRRFANATGVDDRTAEDALRLHLAVCLDTCHAAIEYEDPATCLQTLASAGVGVGKVQLTAGLEATSVTKEEVEALRDFDDEVYLHQVVCRSRVDGAIERFVDLPHAFAAFDEGRIEPGATDWRVHFHVPVFCDDLGPFRTTQHFLRGFLEQLGAFSDPAHPLPHPLPHPLHGEVETYTWDVLPDHLRNVGVQEAIARELQWVLREWAR